MIRAPPITVTMSRDASPPSADDDGLWPPFGLRSDPFFQKELRPIESAAYPIHPLFVGRDTELALIKRQLRGGGESARAIVEGAPGVGKTSFVNRVKVAIGPKHILTHERPVRISGDMNHRGFTAEVLKTLLRMRTAHQPLGATVVAKGRAVVKRHATNAERAREAFWNRIERIVLGQDVTSGGVSVASVGANIERSRIATEISDGSLYEELREAVERLHGETGIRLLIHVNNLENLNRTGAERAALLIRDLRDYFMVPGADWVFAGTSGIERDVFGVYDQVSGIFPSAIILEPLTPGEVATMIERRYLHLRIAKRYVPPVEPSVAAALYRRYRGDLRNFLRLLSDACALLLRLRTVEPLAGDRILVMMGPQRAKALTRRVQQGDFEHLTTLLDGHAADDEFRVTDVAKRTGLTQGGASQFVSRLESRGIIRMNRTEGRSTYYRAIGDVGIALGLPLGSSESP